MGPRDVRWLGWLFLLSLPLLVFGVDFPLLLLSYLLLSLVTPDLLGEVATRPALFAASIALAKLPIALVYMLAVSWRPWTAAVTRGDLLPVRAREGWRRVAVQARDYGMEVATSVAAALVVLEHVIDAGAVRVWPIAILSAVTPFLLALPVKGLVWLTRRWWKSRPSHRPRHPEPSTDDAAHPTRMPS
jgi:hypothetical protein